MEVNFPLTVQLTKMASDQAIDSLVREIAQTMLGQTRERIHEEGKKSDGSQMGKYSKEYLKVRARRYNRTADPKVILSLTGQMENDWSVIALGNQSYGLGYKNSLNADKANWNEDRYGKIFALTKDELKQVQLIVNAWVKKQF